MCSESSGKDPDSTCIDLEPAVNMLLETPPVKKFYLPFEWVLVNGQTSKEIKSLESLSPDPKGDECQTFRDQYTKAGEKDFLTYILSFEQAIDPSLYFLVIRDEVLRTLKERPQNMGALLTRLVLSITSITKNPRSLPSFYVNPADSFVHRIDFSSRLFFPFSFQSKSRSIRKIRTLLYAD